MCLALAATTTIPSSRRIVSNHRRRRRRRTVQAVLQGLHNYLFFTATADLCSVDTVAWTWWSDYGEVSSSRAFGGGFCFTRDEHSLCAISVCALYVMCRQAGR